MTQFIEVCVVERRNEARDVVAFRLKNVKSGQGLPAFDAGAHVDVVLPDGAKRKYSLANFGDERDVFEIAVKREPNSSGGSKWLHEAVFVGDRIQIGRPENLFPLVAGSDRSILLAGGIGITPIISMMRAHIRGGREFDLHYFARGVEFAPYLDKLENLRSHGHVHIHLGLTPEASSDALSQAIAVGTDAHLYYCGPPAFMTAARDIARGRMHDDRIHFEHFAASGDTPRRSGDSFEIVLARSGRSLIVPADKTITDVLYEHGIEVDTSCEAGICGSCKLKVLEGTPQHLDEVLSSVQRSRNDCLLPCVSRSLSSKLVLDL